MLFRFIKVPSLVLIAAVIGLAWSRWSFRATTVCSPTEIPQHIDLGIAGDDATEHALHQSPLEAESPLPATDRRLATDVDATGSFRIEVGHPDGAPLAHATVALVSGGKLVGQRETDPSGIAVLPASRAPVDLYLIVRNTLRSHATFENALGVRRWIVPRGVTLRGTVLVDGAPPRRALHLALVRARGEGVPEALAATGIGSDISALDALSTTVDARGRFRVDELPPDWRGSVRLDEALIAEDGPSSLAIEDPAREVVLRFSERATVSGRIVERGTQRAIPRAAGTFVMMCASGSTRSSLACDEDGRFEIALACLPVRHLDITLSSPGVGRTVIELARVPDEGLALGDLELEPANDLYFVVSDATGDRVRGAVARSAGPELGQSEPTASDGRGVLRSVLATERMVSIEALGFETKEIVLGAEGFSEATPLAVALERRPALCLVLETPDRTPLRDVFVIVRSADARPFASDRGPTADPIQLELGAPRPRRRTIASERSNAAEARITFAYVPDRNGKLCIPGLRPSSQIEVGVEDRAGNVLISRSIPLRSLDRGEELVLRSQSRPTELTLRVLDARGAPLAGAEVSRADGREILGRTDSSGTLNIRLWGSEFSAVVFKSGHAPERVTERSLESPRAERAVVLRPGRTMRVRVVDARGADVAVDSISARFENHGVGARALLDDGAALEFSDLPHEPFDWIVAVGGRRIRERCDTDVETALIALPPFGSLDVAIAPGLAATSGLELRIRAESTTSSAIVRDLASTATSASIHFPILFPGRYTVEVREKGRRDPDGDSPAARAIVEVRADETASVALGLR